MRPPCISHDLLGNSETKARAAFGLRVRAVDLVELLKDASLVLFGNAWSCIGHADVEVAVDRLGSYPDLAGVGELDGVCDAWSNALVAQRPPATCSVWPEM
jgi:hypothetical protein